MGARTIARVVAVAVGLAGWGAAVAAPAPPPVLEPDLPAGIAWAALGWAAVEVPAGAELRFARVPVPAFASTGLWEADGPGVLVAERGRLVIVDDRIGETVADAGRFHEIAQGALIGVRNDEPDEGVVLRLTVVERDAASGTGAVAQIRGPATEVAPLAFVAPLPDPAPDRGADDAPPTPALLFLAAVTWTGGLATDDDGPLLTHAGPLGLVLDEGLLEVAAPSGAPERLATGACAFFAPGAVHRFRPAGEDPARAYALGLVGADQADAGVLVRADDAPDTAAPDAAPGVPEIGRCD